MKKVAYKEKFNHFNYSNKDKIEGKKNNAKHRGAEKSIYFVWMQSPTTH